MELLENVILNKEEELYKALTYYRLKISLKAIEDKMEENSPKDYSKEDNIIKREFGKNIINTVKRGIVRDLSEEKKKALDDLDTFEAQNGKAYEKTKEELNEAIYDMFKDDCQNEARIMMALRLALSEDYNYVESKKSLRELSSLLFDNEDKIEELYDSLKQNFYKINKADLRNVEKGVFIGLGIATAAALIAGPIGLTATAATNAKVAASLAALAGASAHQFGAGVAVVTVGLVTSNILLMGATAGVLSVVEIRKNEELKKEFRNISSENLAMKLAIKATLIEDIKNSNTGDVLPYIDDALHVLDDYRADAEYMMIVEKLDAKNAKKKISVCNNLSQRLAEIVGI